MRVTVWFDMLHTRYCLRWKTEVGDVDLYARARVAPGSHCPLLNLRLRFFPHFRHVAI